VLSTGNAAVDGPAARPGGGGQDPGPRRRRLRRPAPYPQRDMGMWVGRPRGL